jgi:pSer/pThr/pTyr-binding forkhead associated (FHA) protein
MNMRTLLVPLDGGEPIELVKDLTVVGRREDCDVRLEHKSVSKVHCVLVRSDDTLLLRDLGSTNSTRVNGQRVRRAALKSNDQLTIATFKFKVQFTDGTQDAEPARPDEYTQQLDANEVVKLLNREKANKEAAAKEPPPADDDGDDSEIIPQPIQQNPLPDLYPDEKKN